MATKTEIYIKERDKETGRIVASKKVLLVAAQAAVMEMDFFHHWLFGGIRRKAARYVFDYLHEIKNNARREG